MATTAKKTTKKVAKVEAEDEAKLTPESEKLEGQAGNTAEVDATDDEELKKSEKDLDNSEEDSEESEARLQSEEKEPTDENLDKDWLMQYQVRVISGKQIQGGIHSNPVPGSDAEHIKKLMLSGPKVQMFFPLVNSESANSMQTVNVNGYRLDFPKQTYVFVPRIAADVLMESLKQTNQALQQFLIKGDEEEFIK